MQGKGRIYIGVSGWSYKHWRGTFYPEDMPEDQWLDYCAKFFASVEVNNTFYNLPEENTFKKWYQSTPRDFIFSVKASRYITHMKKLKDPSKTLPKIFDRAKILAEKLGPILFQLPPGWKCNIERLRFFLDSLTGDYRYTFEFRNPDWFNQQVYDLLSSRNAAFCIYELDRKMSPEQVTADFVYIRLHGPEGPYEGQYSQKVLWDWAKRIRKWQGQGRDVYCYFDNDQAGYAAQDAVRFGKILK